MPDRPTTVSRRTLLAGGLAGSTLVLGACDPVDDLFGGGEDPAASGTVSPTAPAVDADSSLVEEVVAAIAATSALASATAAVPSLAAAGTRLARVHQAHLAELGGTDPAAPPAVSADPALARTRLFEGEAALQRRLVEAALTAESGALAQVLASMAGSLAQLRTVLR